MVIGTIYSPYHPDHRLVLTFSLSRCALCATRKHYWRNGALYLLLQIANEYGHWWRPPLHLLSHRCLTTRSGLSVVAWVIFLQTRMRRSIVLWARPSIVKSTSYINRHNMKPYFKVVECNLPHELQFRRIIKNSLQLVLDDAIIYFERPINTQKMKVPNSFLRASHSTINGHRMLSGCIIL